LVIVDEIPKDELKNYYCKKNNNLYINIHKNQKTLKQRIIDVGQILQKLQKIIDEKNLGFKIQNPFEEIT